MTNFQKMLQTFVDLPYDELLEIAKRQIPVITNAVNRLPSENKNMNAPLVLSSAIFACIGIDGRLSDRELRFFNDFLGTSYTSDELVALVATVRGDACLAILYSVSKGFTTDERAALVKLCLSFLSVDGSLERDEIAFIKSLME